MNVEVDGLAQFINRLEKFDKDVSKTLKGEMRSAASMVSKAASGLTPGSALSNWGSFTADGSRGGQGRSGNDVSFSSSAVRRGFRVATNRYRKRGVTVAFGYDVKQSNPGGSVFETVGKTSGTFMDNIVAKFTGTRPRTLLPAYYAGIGPAQAKIEDAIRRAEREVGL